MANDSEKSGRPPLHRRRYLVDRRMQLDLALRAALAVGALLVAMGFALFLPMARRIEHETDPMLRNDVGVALLYLHANYWPLVLASVCFAFGGMILLSHRIAGPLVRVRRVFAAVGAGRLPGHLTIRRRDHLGAEVDLLNAMLDALDARTSAVRVAEAELRAALAAGAGVDAAVARLAAAIAELPTRGVVGPTSPQSARPDAAAVGDPTPAGVR